MTGPPVYADLDDFFKEIYVSRVLLLFVRGVLLISGSLLLLYTACCSGGNNSSQHKIQNWYLVHHQFNGCVLSAWCIVHGSLHVMKHLGY